MKPTDMILAAMHRISEVNSADADGLTIGQAATIANATRAAIRNLNKAYDIAHLAESAQELLGEPFGQAFTTK